MKEWTPRQQKIKSILLAVNHPERQGNSGFMESITEAIMVLAKEVDDLEEARHHHYIPKGSQFTGDKEKI